MKPLMTLTVAVVSSFFCNAQPVPPAGKPLGKPAGKIVPLTGEDSLVLAEAGLPGRPAASGLGGAGGVMGAGSVTAVTGKNGLVAVPGTLAAADRNGAAPAEAAPAGAARADTLVHADSTLRARVLPFPETIDAVLKDFPYNLRHITGELVLAEGETDNYASAVEIPDAESCLVTRYHSAVDTTASWQAKMASGLEFDEAARMYQELYRKLQGCYMKEVDGSIFYLDGVWEPARENAAFTTSTLRVRTEDPAYKEVKVELELVYQLAQWGININIVSKKRDDEVGGKRDDGSPQ